jgi:thiol-disulfide isomerase/thioredoxin
MRIRYFALMMMVSILSSGTIVGCSNSTSSPGTETAAKVNPCAAKTNPCAAKTNPCAAKANPCAAKTNPCAAKANPCAAKTNPCAAKTNPCAAKNKPAVSLATELQGKPVIVDIYASWCPACKNVAPTLETLKKEYQGKANFVVLDVSDKTSTTKAIARAKELGLEQFLAKNQTQTGLIAILDPATGKVLVEARDNTEVATYKKPLDAFIAQAK